MKLLKVGLFIIFIVFFIIIFRLWSFANKSLEISVFKAIFTKGDLRIVDDSTNFLILGIPGSTYDGPELSDSIIFLNYNFKKNRVVLFGIPRDIWSNSLQDKINTAYIYGEVVKDGGGLILSKAEVGSIVGIPIQYGLVVDFDDFKKIIDYFGGIKVEVKRSFKDERFPIKGKENDECEGDKSYDCRYETVRFDEGVNEMDGERALKFIRSRNSIGAEGNDFARINRQQLVVKSIKDEALANVGIFNLNKTKDFYNIINSLVERDISNQQATAILKNILLRGNFVIINKTIPSSLFFTPEYSSYNGKYVLTPKNNTYENIHKYIKESLK